MKTLIVTLLALLGLTAAVHSQTLLIQTYNSPTSNWTIGKYDATNGTAINPAVRAGLADCWDLLVDTPYTFFTYNYGGVARFDSTTGATLPGGITGSTFSSPGHLALDGAGYMLVASANNKVAKYSMSDWSLVNASFISGLNSVGGMATDMSGHLFISNTLGNTIGKYDLATGTVINASFITGLSSPREIAIDAAGNLFVANNAAGTIGKYDANLTAINASFIMGLSSPDGLALDGNGDLFIAEIGAGRIGKYSATTGDAIAAAFVSGLPLSTSASVEIQAIPEPETYAALVGFTMLAYAVWRRRRS